MVINRRRILIIIVAVIVVIVAIFESNAYLMQGRLRKLKNETLVAQCAKLKFQCADSKDAQKISCQAYEKKCKNISIKSNKTSFFNKLKKKPKIVPHIQNYAIKNWINDGNVEDVSLRAGDKLRISDQLNIRIENIDFNRRNDLTVRYSIWGRNNNDVCEFISNTGELTLNADYNFREFTDGFIELISGDRDSVVIRKYTGSQARQRCESIAGWKKRTACSFYPNGHSFYIENEYFKIFFDKNDYLERAAYVADTMKNCLSEIRNKIPGARNVTPYKDKWGVYAQIEGGSSMSADYERISIPAEILEFPNVPLSDYTAEIEGGRCPISMQSLPHELVHLIFSGTILDMPYDDGYARILPLEESADTMYLKEGKSDYMPMYLVKSYPDFENKDWYYNQQCGERELVNQNDESSPEQRQYSNILSGRGYDSNHYAAGYCFFRGVENDCGIDSINYILEQAIERKGSAAGMPNVFQHLVQVCDRNRIIDIMDDFGFSQRLFEMQQTYPQGTFLGGKQGMGCI